jgi:hypothetical protein
MNRELPIVEGNADRVAGTFASAESPEDSGEVDLIVMKLADEKVNSALKEDSDGRSARDNISSTGAREPPSFAPVDGPSHAVSRPQ